MRRTAALTAALALLSLSAGRLPAQPPSPGLESAHGEIRKVTRDVLTVRPRDEAGRFGKELELRLTGTSRISVVTVQERAGKPAFVQQEAAPSDLKPGQPVAVIYAAGASGPVLLTGRSWPPRA